GLDLVETVHEDDAVGVAHGHDRGRDLAAVRQHERHRHRLAVGAGHRNRRGAEARRAHLDGDEAQSAVPLVARALHHAALRVDAERRAAARVPVVPQVLGYDAEAVARLPGLADLWTAVCKHAY